MNARTVPVALIAMTAMIGRTDQTVPADPIGPSAPIGRSAPSDQTARPPRDRTGHVAKHPLRPRAMIVVAPISAANAAMTVARARSAGMTAARARRLETIAARAASRPGTEVPVARPDRIAVPAPNALKVAVRVVNSPKIAARALHAGTTADPGVVPPEAIADLALELGTKGSARVPPISPERRVWGARPATTPARAGPRAPAGTGRARARRATAPNPTAVRLARVRLARGRRVIAGQRAPRRCASLPGVFAARD